MSWFPYLYNSTYLKVLWGLNKTLYVKSLQNIAGILEFLAPNNHFVNTSWHYYGTSSNIYISLHSLNHLAIDLINRFLSSLYLHCLVGNTFSNVSYNIVKCLIFLCSSLSDTNYSFYSIQFGNHWCRCPIRFLQSLHLTYYELFESRDYILFICIFLMLSDSEDVHKLFVELYSSLFLCIKKFLIIPNHLPRHN